VQMVVSAVCLWSVFCRGYAATVNERCVQESRRMIMMETEERLEDIPLYSRWRVAARCCRKMQGVSTFPCNVRWKLPCVWVEGMEGVRRKSRRRQVRGQHTGDEGSCIDNLRNESSKICAPTDSLRVFENMTPCRVASLGGQPRFQRPAAMFSRTLGPGDHILKDSWPMFSKTLSDLFFWRSYF